MDSTFIDDLVKWATIGQFVLALLAVILQIYALKVPIGPAIRRIAPWIFSGLSLTVPYYLAFRGSIFLATVVPGTIEALVVRATACAIFFGMLWGFIWTKFILPRII